MARKHRRRVNCWQLLVRSEVLKLHRRGVEFSPGLLWWALQLYE
jgi:hypothetical protein